MTEEKLTNYVPAGGSIDDNSVVERRRLAARLRGALGLLDGLTVPAGDPLEADIGKLRELMVKLEADLEAGPPR